MGHCESTACCGLCSTDHDWFSTLKHWHCVLVWCVCVFVCGYLFLYATRISNFNYFIWILLRSSCSLTVFCFFFFHQDVLVFAARFVRWRTLLKIVDSDAWLGISFCHWISIGRKKWWFSHRRCGFPWPVSVDTKNKSCEPFSFGGNVLLVVADWKRPSVCSAHLDRFCFQEGI